MQRACRRTTNRRRQHKLKFGGEGINVVAPAITVHACRQLQRFNLSSDQKLQKAGLHAIAFRYRLCAERAEPSHRYRLE